MIFLMGCCLAWQVAEAQQPPQLRGQVKYLNGEVAANIMVQLLEPELESGTKANGVFKFQFQSGSKWVVGKQVTLFMEGYEVIRPWDGKLTIQLDSDEKIEHIIIARPKLAQMIRNTAELERVLLPLIEAPIRDRTQPSGFSEYAVLSDEAERLNISPEELLTLLNEWKTHVEERGTWYEKGLAALLEKEYGDAILLLERDLAADEQDIERADSLEALRPRKYLNLGIAYAGEYKHEKAEAAYKKALGYDPTFYGVYIPLADTYEFTGRLADAMIIYRAEARRYEARADIAVLNGIGGRSRSVHTSL